MRSTPGFTIIETSLFLAISGVLIMGMIATAGVSLANQRYKDAAVSLRDTIQQQYADTLNVQSSRPTTISCTPTAEVTDTGVGEAIGQSACVVVGRYLRIDTNGTMTTYNVLARQTSSTANLSDIDSLRTNYILGVDTSETNETRMEWGTEIAWPRSGTGSRATTDDRVLGMLVVRSPDSGRVYTFTADTIPDDATSVPATYLQSLLVSGDSVPGQATRVVCVASTTWNTSEAFAIRIAAYAAGASAVDIWTNRVLLEEAATYGSFPSDSDSTAGPAQC